MKKIKEILKKDKKNTILMLITILFLLALVFGAAYAYFAAQTGAGGKLDISASTGSTDNLMFLAGEPINIHATLENFGKGKESLKDETTASAKLLPNSGTNTAIGRYNIFFIIDVNDFEYTTKTYEPELLIKIYDPNNNEVKEIEGLKRTETGFDITTRTGSFLIRSDNDIEASSAEGTIQDWRVEVTLVNLDSDQNNNMGKTLNGKVYITTEQISTYETPIINSIEPVTNYHSITASLDVTEGTEKIDKYYFAIEEVNSPIAFNDNKSRVRRLANTSSLEWIEKDVPYHTFENLKENTSYKVYGYGINKYGISTNYYESIIATDPYILPVIDSVTTSSTTSSIKVNASASKGTSDISKYYYSINNGDYQESSSNEYTFNNLAENTTYKINVKVVDSIKRESEVYSINVKTVKLATINSIDATPTSNSIRVVVNATKGDDEISGYIYSIDNGASWTDEQSDNTYTFSNLNSNTTYNIKVKVIDSKGRESSEGIKSVKTDYVLPSVTNVVATDTQLYSITVEATAQKGSNNIKYYYFSKDNGVTWSNGETSNTYTFSNLQDTTEYKIKVKVSDTDNRESSAFYKAISTVTYINPTINTVETTSTWNSITLNVTAAGGTNNISKYYYKKGTDSEWIEVSSSSYTFNNLTDNTTYNFKVKVIDTNDRYSVEKEVNNIKTDTYTLPRVTATVSDITSKSFKINATGKNGTGSIVSYAYSKDGGSNWTSWTNSNSYTYSSLTAGGTYQVSVKVKDSNGRESTKYDIANVKTLGVFTNNTTNYTGTYDGSAKSITVNVNPSATIYYSESTALNAGNYSANGSTTKPTRTNAGTTTVYWCAVKSGYETLCSNNKITINKITPTLSLSSTTSSISASSTTSNITYTYNGNGTVSCSLASGSGATCSVDQTNKRITFTRSNNNGGTPKFTINASSTTNYNAPTSKSITVNVTKVSLATLCQGQNMATCFKQNYTKDSSIYYHNSSLANGAGDNSYRYAGPSNSVNNFVCFGSTASTCPNDNLYRIIGIFGSQIKLIKYDYATTTLLGTNGDFYGNINLSDVLKQYYKGSLTTMPIYYLNYSNGTSSTNDWSKSRLNTINLNTNFLNNIGNTWSNKIANTTWNVGGMIYSEGSKQVAKSVYDREVGVNKTAITYNAKIGLMYIHEYLYSASPAYWTKEGGHYHNDPVPANNWMYMGYYEWIITPSTYNSYLQFNINFQGGLSHEKVYFDSFKYTVRPTFNLISSITLSSGEGTKTNPYRIN